jgi:hypothetical protein
MTLGEQGVGRELSESGARAGDQDFLRHSILLVDLLDAAPEGNALPPGRGQFLYSDCDTTPSSETV